jgi:selenocysteine lyase/cysteine desulfurase
MVYIFIYLGYFPSRVLIALLSSLPGSYGSSPLAVLEAAHNLTLEVESNPDLFHRQKMQSRLISAREQIAKIVGAKADEVVFTTNASMGINTVLRNLEWEKGDTILVGTYLRFFCQLR